MESRYLEVRTALKRASKTDLFTGDVNNMRAKQGIKENATVFFRDPQTNEIIGPQQLHDGTNFITLFYRYAFGLVGVIAPMPNVITNEFVFDLVLREAELADVMYNSRHIRYYRVYYIYDKYNLTGPFYTNSSTTLLFLQNLVCKNQLFVPNDLQHFKKKELKKAV